MIPNAGFLESGRVIRVGGALQQRKQGGIWERSNQFYLFLLQLGLQAMAVEIFKTAQVDPALGSKG